MDPDTRQVTVLDTDGREALASQLGERPETAISLHVLRTGDGIALAIGETTPFAAALVGWSDNLGWPQGYGDPSLIVALLASYPSWTAVCVASPDGGAVASARAEHTGRPSRQIAEVYYELDRPPTGDHSAARVLDSGDLAVLDPSAAELDIADPRALLRNCIAAGVVLDDRVVALAHNGANSTRYGDVGVATLERYRRRGFASACGRLVAARVLESDRVPVWCTGDDNTASERTATAIGFREVSRRVSVFSA